MSAQSALEPNVTDETHESALPGASQQASNPPDGAEQKAIGQPDPTPAISQADREQAAARVQQLIGLPQALRDRLAALVLASGKAEASGTALVPIDETARAVEETLPDFLRPGRDRAASPQHPGGEEFFHGDPSELTDAEAEELARGQLARSGLLRGQRTRVAAE